MTNSGAENMDQTFDYEALWRLALKAADEAMAGWRAERISHAEAVYTRDMLARRCSNQAHEIVALRQRVAELVSSTEPQAAYIAELRDASPILAAIAVHQSQGVR